MELKNSGNMDCRGKPGNDERMAKISQIDSTVVMPGLDPGIHGDAFEALRAVAPRNEKPYLDIRLNSTLNSLILLS